MYVCMYVYYQPPPVAPSSSLFAPFPYLPRYSYVVSVLWFNGATAGTYGSKHTYI